MFEFRLIVLDHITNDDETFEAAGGGKYYIEPPISELHFVQCMPKEAA